MVRLTSLQIMSPVSRLSPFVLALFYFWLLPPAKSQPSEVPAGSDQNRFAEEKSAVGLEATQTAQGSERQDSNTDGVAHPWSVGATAGSLVGIGGSVGYDFSKSFGISALVGNFDIKLKTDDVNFNYSLGGAALQSDWHPFKSPLRLSIGLVSSESKMNANTKIYGGIRYDDGDGSSIETELEYNSKADLNFPSSISPYLGIGTTWGRQNSRWSLSMGGGYVFRGTPKLSISFSEDNCSFNISGKGQANIGGSCENSDSIRQDLEETFQRVEKKIEDYSFIFNFVGNVSLSYRF